MTKNSLSLFAMINSFVVHKGLIHKMVKRDIEAKHNGSILGGYWPFVSPLVLLLVYSFVFSVVFKTKWISGETISTGEYSLIMFAGMIFHSFLANTMIQATDVIINNKNYVKKVVFPLEILPVIKTVENFFYFLVGCILLLAAVSIVNQSMSWAVLYLPFIVIPCIFFVLGVAWFFASFGVYIRDLSNTVSLFATVLLFLSPVFYSESALPENYRIWLQLNPLTYFIEESRRIILWGGQPNIFKLVIVNLMSLIFSWFCFILFQKMKKGFADVI